MSLADLWVALESQPAAPGLALTRLHPDSPHDLHLAVDLAARRRQLLYGRRWRPTDVLPEFPVTQAINCRATLESAGRRMVIAVELLDPALNDVFTPLVEDLAGRVAATGSDKQATEELVNGLSHWKDLFDELSRIGLSELVRRGLAGELLVLLEDVLPHVPPSRAVAAWTGPLKKNQDFQLPAVALEVKVTTGQQPQGFIVANERELDPTGTDQLVVVHLSLDERRGGAGRTVNDLVHAVRQALDGDPLPARDFAEKLARVGYLDAHHDLYLEPRYELRAATYLEVRSDFPRITEADLRAGVGAVRYTVSLAACSGFELSRSDVHAAITRGAT